MRPQHLLATLFALATAGCADELPLPDDPYEQHEPPEAAVCIPGACIVRVEVDDDRVVVRALEGTYVGSTDAPLQRAPAAVETPLSRLISAGSAADAVPVEVLVTPDGQVVVATFGAGVLVGAGLDGLQPANEGLGSLLVTGVAAGSSGQLHATTIGGGLVRWEAGTWTRVAEPELPLLSAVGATDGGLYVGTDTGLLHSGDGGASWTAVPEVQQTVTSISTTADGAVFVGTWGHGLYRRRPGESGFEPVDVAHASTWLTALAATGDGALIGTGRGEVHRLRGEAWERVGATVHPEPVLQVAAGPDGEVYASTPSGITWFDEGQAERLLDDGAPFAAVEEGVVVAREVGLGVEIVWVPQFGEAQVVVPRTRAHSRVRPGGIAREPGGRVVVLDGIPPLASTDEGRSFALAGEEILGTRFGFEGVLAVGPTHTALVKVQEHGVTLIETGGPYDGGPMSIPTRPAGGGVVPPLPCVAPLPGGGVVSLVGGEVHRVGTARSGASAPSCSALVLLSDGSALLVDGERTGLHRTTDFASFEPVALWTEGGAR